MRLKPGDDAPSFTLPDHDGTPVTLADYRGRRVVVHFYPKDDTRGCTVEACGFNDALASFADSRIDVLGISADDAESHQRFRAKFGLRFRLLTDADFSVAEAYGAYGERASSTGSTVTRVLRATFAVGPDGRLERVWYDVDATGHAEQVLAALNG
ncbi:MAG: peroxiredoxin [Acidimicrobiales bacterium]